MRLPRDQQIPHGDWDYCRLPSAKSKCLEICPDVFAGLGRKVQSSFIRTEIDIKAIGEFTNKAITFRSRQPEITLQLG